MFTFLKAGIWEFGPADDQTSAEGDFLIASFQF
jgi:hypothetical protein